MRRALYLATALAFAVARPTRARADEPNAQTRLQTQASTPPSEGLETRQLVGIAVIGVGVVLVSASAYEVTLFTSARSDLNAARQNNYGEPPPPISDPCHPEQQDKPPTDATRAGCDAMSRAATARTVALLTGSLGLVAAGTGLYLLLSGPSAQKAASLRLAPYGGPSGVGAAIVGRF
jgi:hypothetical protein